MRFGLVFQLLVFYISPNSVDPTCFNYNMYKWNGIKVRENSKNAINNRQILRNDIYKYDFMEFHKISSYKRPCPRNVIAIMIPLSAIG